MYPQTATNTIITAQKEAYLQAVSGYGIGLGRTPTLNLAGKVPQATREIRISYFALLSRRRQQDNPARN